MGVYSMIVGDTLPPARRGPRPCPKCKDAVFKSFITGFVDEVDTIVSKSGDGFKILEDWHCPACGYRERKFHYVDSNGLRTQQKPLTNVTTVDVVTEAIPYSVSTETVDTGLSTTTGDSSDKHKKKRRHR